MAQDTVVGAVDAEEGDTVAVAKVSDPTVLTVHMGKQNNLCEQKYILIRLFSSVPMSYNRVAAVVEAVAVVVANEENPFELRKLAIIIHSNVCPIVQAIPVSLAIVFPPSFLFSHYFFSLLEKSLKINK